MVIDLWGNVQRWSERGSSPIRGALLESSNEQVGLRFQQTRAYVVQLLLVLLWWSSTADALAQERLYRIGGSWNGVAVTGNGDAVAVGSSGRIMSLRACCAPIFQGSVGVN